MKYEEGDVVVIVSGNGEGLIGTVTGAELGGNYTVDVNGLAVVKPIESLAPVEELEDDYETYEAPEDTEVPSFGMTSDALAEYAAKMNERVSQRIKGVGQEQYSEGDYQKFEAMPLPDLLVMTLEEIEDIAAYLPMMHIRVRRLLKALRDRS